jgi:hypothetical protein
MCIWIASRRSGRDTQRCAVHLLGASSSRGVTCREACSGSVDLGDGAEPAHRALRQFPGMTHWAQRPLRAAPGGWAERMASGLPAAGAHPGGMRQTVCARLPALPATGKAGGEIPLGQPAAAAGWGEWRGRAPPGGRGWQRASRCCRGVAVGRICRCRRNGMSWRSPSGGPMEPGEAHGMGSEAKGSGRSMSIEAKQREHQRDRPVVCWML